MRARRSWRLWVLLAGLALACSSGGGSDPDDSGASTDAKVLDWQTGDGAVDLDAPDLGEPEADGADADVAEDELDAEVAPDQADIEDVQPDLDPSEIPCDDDAPCLAALGHAPDECGSAACDPERGACVIEIADDLTLCGVEDPCASRAVCIGGDCRVDAVRPIVCDDGNPCTDDACVQGACVFTPNVNFCDDGNPCTSQDRCLSGACQGNPKPGCACLHDVDCAPFDDDDPCNGVLGCVEGSCRPLPGSHPHCERYIAPPCQRAVCDPEAGGCVFEPLADELPCDDHNACTVEEYCLFGECFGLNACDCETDEDCAAYDDGDACNGVLGCHGGECRSESSSYVSCGDPLAEPCASVACEPTTGDCVSEAAHDGAPCLDLDACTKGEVCVAGACLPSGEVGCDDLNPCTADFCDAELGCLHQNLDSPCDDGNPCTQNEYCQAGMCVPKDLSSCHDDDPCTDDLCDEGGGCVFVPNEQPCDDGNPCTTGDTCVSGGCVAGQDTCGACETDVDCDPFDDDDLCNGLLNCLDGLCAIDPETLVVCDPAADTACTEHLCDSESAQCKMTPVNEGKPCDDGDACTGNDACQLGLCLGLPLSCEDDNPCTDDHCGEDGACAHEPNAAPCDDGDPCTGGDTCAGGACAPGIEARCAGGCATDDDCAQFDDGDPCNGLVTCQGGQCAYAPDTVIVCPDDGDSACRKNLCEPGTGACAMQDLPDGMSCNDQDVCSEPDTCAGGYCSGPSVDCDDDKLCTTDSCSIFYGCVHFNNELACDDGDACTEGDRCADGLCLSGALVDCDDQNVCTLDSCDLLAGCEHEDLTEELCDDGIACTSDECDPVLGCVNEIICPEYCGNELDDDLDGKTDCDDPDCQLDAACTGQGQCFPIQTLGCDAQTSGDLDWEEAEDKIYAYPCKAASFDGPELSYVFTAPCTDKVTVTVTETVADGSPILDLFVIQEQDGACIGTQCEGWGYGPMMYVTEEGKATVVFLGHEDQTYYFVVDGRNGDTGTYSLFVSCDCVL